VQFIWYESMNTNYGALADVVAGAGSLSAVAVAVRMSFMGRASWEPCEQDVPAGPQKIGGFVSALAIAIIWVCARDANSKMSTHLVVIAILFGVATVFFLIAYGFLIGTMTFTRPGSTKKKKEEKIIGGFCLTLSASVAKASGLTIQEFFDRGSHKPDYVWTRSSRALAKQMFVVAYLGLVSSGTIGLATASILVSQALLHVQSH